MRRLRTFGHSYITAVPFSDAQQTTLLERHRVYSASPTLYGSSPSLVRKMERVSVLKGEGLTGSRSLEFWSPTVEC